MADFHLFLVDFRLHENSSWQSFDCGIGSYTFLPQLHQIHIRLTMNLVVLQKAKSYRLCFNTSQDSADT